MSVVEDFFDYFRGLLPYYCVLLLPVFIIISPVDPIRAAQDFTAYRLQQLDLQGVKLGSRSSSFNLEAQTALGRHRGRKCLLLRIMEASAAAIKLAISQNVGSVIVLLPQKSAWNDEVVQHLLTVERELLADEFAVPVYFVWETPSVSDMYEGVRRLTEAGRQASAAQALFSAVTSNGYQLYTAHHTSGPLNDFDITNFYGKLAGNGIEEQLPTVLIAADYDSMGLVPSLSYGYDSNGSGVVVLLQLMRLFSRLYASGGRSQGRYNVAFLLAGGGKLNYIGTKKWLEELHEHTDGTLSADRIAAVLCLDMLGIGDGLFVHVSRPPRDGSAAHRLLEALQAATTNRTIGVVHKRVNLNEDELRWQHERFSLKKIPAVTLSTQQTDDAAARRSMLDDRLQVDVLTRNTRVAAEALMRLVYGIEGASGQLTDAGWIDEAALAADVALVTRFPRGQQLLDKRHPLLLAFDNVFRRFSQRVQVSRARADPRDPEFVLYSGSEVNIVAHRVKPAIFDCMIACLVAAYLGLLFLFMENFPAASRLLLRLTVVSNDRAKKHI